MKTSLAFLLLLQAALPSITCITPSFDERIPSERNAGILTIDHVIRDVRDENTSSSCTNEYNDVDCEDWAKRGDCETVEIVRDYCKKSCEFCQSDGPKSTQKLSCVNEHNDFDCESWANNEQCDKNPVFMKARCRKSCKACQSDETTAKPTEDSPCVNMAKDIVCESWANNRQCDNNPGFMNVRCRKTCNVCQPDESKPSCVNEHDDISCESWAENKQCDSNPGFMKIKCKKACKVCHSDESSELATPTPTEESMDWSCGDFYDLCPVWAENGGCNSNTDFMLPNCRKSCNKCPDGTCMNMYNDEKCTNWAEEGECDDNPDYMLENCRKACDKCPDGTCKNLYSDEWCTDSADDGECTNTGFVYHHCEKACGTGLCDGQATTSSNISLTTPGCVNNHNDLDCESWAKTGQCDLNPGFMKDRCRKACSFCASDAFSKVTTPKPTKGCVDESQWCDSWASIDGCKTNPGYMLKTCRKACKVC